MEEIYREWENILIQRGEEVSELGTLRVIAQSLSENLSLTPEEIAKGLNVSLDEVMELLKEKP